MRSAKLVQAFGILLIATAFGCTGTTDSGDGDGDGDGNPNDSDGDGVVDEIEFAPTRGFFDEAVTVSLTTNETHDEIRYTTDGSTPSVENGAVYSGPIVLDGSAVVRSVLIAGGAAVSPVRTHSYFVKSEVFAQGDVRPDGDYVFWTTEMDPIITEDAAYAGSLDAALTSIPTLSISLGNEQLFGVAGIHRGNNLMEGSGGNNGDPPHADWVDEVEASIELLYPANYARGSFHGFQVNAGLKTQGGGGRWRNGTYDHKQSFGLRFRAAYGSPTLKYPIFEDAPLNSDGEAGKYDKLILRAGHNKSWGATWDNERSAYTRDQLGRDLQLQLSGIGARGTFAHLFLNGIYWGVYNITERPDDAHAARYFGGSEEEYYSGKAKGGTVDGDSTRFDAWRGGIAGNGNFDQLQEYLDVDSYIDMCLLNVYAATGDFPQFYFANRFAPEPGPLYFFTWDTEDGFGGGSRRTGPPSVDRFGQCYEFFAMWDANQEFRERLAARALAAAEGTGGLSDASVTAAWSALNTYIEEAMILESARWGDERMSETGVRYTRDEHWRSARDLVRADLDGRAAQFLDLLRNSRRNGEAYIP